MANAETEDEQHCPDPANFATVTPLEDAIWQAVSAPSAQPQSDAEPLLTEEEIAALPPAVQAIERERASQAAKSSRARSLWRPWQHEYLIRLRLMAGVASLAAPQARTSVWSVARYREADPVFDADCQAIQDAAIDRQEAALHVSGSIGDIKPVFQGGEHVGDERRKSERAALALLGAERPAKWRPDGTAQVAIGISMPPAQAIADAMARLTNEIAPVEIAQAIEDKPVTESQ